MIRWGLAIVLAATALASWRPSMAAAQLMDRKIYTFVLFDQLEYRGTTDGNPVRWDMLGWVGSDVTRFWVKAEGTRATRGPAGDLEVQALYGRLIAPFWDFQAGLQTETRRDAAGTRTRTQVVVGLEGLAPYWFELEPAIFVSQDGDISAQLTGTTDLFLTQRLIAQPRADVRAAVQEVPDFRVGSGLNDLKLGLRVRYEIRREYAPYAGVSWMRKFAGTAALARQAGEPVRDVTVVGGIRFWF
jgi:copper resistance protein B